MMSSSKTHYKNGPKRPCKYSKCGVVFTPFADHHVYCSAKCQLKGYDLERRLTMRPFETFSKAYDSMVSKVNLPRRQVSSFKPQYCNMAFKIRNKQKPSSKYRSAELLAPATLFMFLKAKCIGVTAHRFVNANELDYKEFKSNLKHLTPFYPRYLGRDRRTIVENDIKAVVEHFRLGQEFLDGSKAVFGAFWNSLKNTTEGVVTGVVVILTMIKMDAKTPIYLDICKKIPISLSAVHYQVKQKVLKPSSAANFRGLVNSRDVVKNAVERKVSLYLNGSNKLSVD